MPKVFQQQRRDYHNAKIQVAKEKKLVDFSVINPDIPPPKELLDKLTEYILQDNSFRYVPASGTPDFIGAACEKYQKSFRVRLEQGSVCACSGTYDALNSIFSALANSRALVLLPRPYYTFHLEAVIRSGLKPCFYNLHADQEELLEEIENTIQQNSPQFLITNFPNNPTGQVIGDTFYTALTEIASRKNVMIINDFVYGDLADNSTSLLKHIADSQQLIEIYSLSKSYSVPGWRIGFLAGSENLLKKITTFKSETSYGSMLAIQKTAAYALERCDGYITYLKNRYRQRAKVFKTASYQSGCSLWLEIPENLSMNSMEFCTLLLKERGMALQPGEIFGIENSRYFRVSLTADDDLLQNAANTIADSFY